MIWGIRDSEIRIMLEDIAEKLATMMNFFNEESVSYIFEDFQDTLNHINDRVFALTQDQTRQDSVALAEKTLDKFDDYMKNVDKVNNLVNEVKGCSNMARAALQEKKESSEELSTTIKDLVNQVSLFLAHNNMQISRLEKSIRRLEKKVKSEKKKSPKKKKVSSKEASSRLHS